MRIRERKKLGVSRERRREKCVGQIKRNEKAPTLSTCGEGYL